MDYGLAYQIANVNLCQNGKIIITLYQYVDAIQFAIRSMIARYVPGGRQYVSTGSVVVGYRERPSQLLSLHAQPKWEDRVLSSVIDILRKRPANPDYGSGYFVRTWVMRRLAAGRLEVVMEDSFHAFAMMLSHSDTHLVEVAARWARRPLTSCAGAEIFLEIVKNTRLTGDLGLPLGDRPASAHCTHLLDTCRLGVAHAAHDRPDRRYEVVIPDRLDDLYPIHLFINGTEQMCIMVKRDMTIHSPARFAGAPLMGGFTKWARNELSAELAECFTMMQRSAFVAEARRVDMARYVGQPAILAGPPEGSCYASRRDRYMTAVRNGCDRPGLLREDAARFRFADLDPSAADIPSQD